LWEFFMNRRIKVATLIISCWLSIILLAACSGSQSPAVSSTPKAPNPSLSPGGAVPSGAAGGAPTGSAPVGSPPAGGASGLPGTQDKGPGSKTQSGLNLPLQNNSVVGTGAVAVGNYAKLFFGSSGQITSILVKQGDQVTRDQILAKLDTATLEATIAQYQANVDQAQANIDTVQQNLLQSQQNLVIAHQNLNAQADVNDLQTKINNANIQVQQATVMLKSAQSRNNSGDADYWKDVIYYYSEDTHSGSTSAKHVADGGLIGTLQKQMSQLLDDPANAGATLVTDATAATVIQKYTLAIEIAEQSIVAGKSNLTQAQSNLVTQKKNLSLIKAQLDGATIKAPFDGIIARVYSQAGDIVAAPAMAANPVIYLIDPGSLQLEIFVNELDLPLVKIQQKASVNINAYPDAKIEGVVNSISPLPTTLGGVIYYTVTIRFSAPSGLDIRIGMNGAATLAGQ
jgi:HlyD family secretion protein